MPGPDISNAERTIFLSLSWRTQQLTCDSLPIHHLKELLCAAKDRV